MEWTPVIYYRDRWYAAPSLAPLPPGQTLPPGDSNRRKKKKNGRAHKRTHYI